ncbi:MAG: GNAT family N-acetyltransferase, partial [Acidimicrobiales bacterium]
TLCTGHCLVDAEDHRRVSRVARTVVRFGTPTSQEIAAYVSTGEATELAGGFSIDGPCGAFVEGIDGDPGNVLGLSLPLLRAMLLELGVSITELWRRAFGGVVRDLADADRAWLDGLVRHEWGLPVVSVSGAHDPAQLEGLVAVEGGERIGVLTFASSSGGVEVVTLNSLVENRGVGSALLAAARARAAGSRQRLWLVTTNENLNAIGFYQRRGMEIAGFHRDFADEVRRLKPEGDRSAPGPIESRHAIEFEYREP